MVQLDDDGVSEVLGFWFGDLAGPYDVDGAASKRWFERSDAFDDEVRRRFGARIEAALRGELESLAFTPRRRLALVLLLDQMTRNVFRDTPRMYAGDERSLRLAKEAIANDELKALSYVERTFVLMPLMHSEALEDQRESVRRWQGLLDELPANERQSPAGKLLESGVSFAQRHLEIVERFGRFPHRNAILGRECTPAEQEFLTKPGSSF